VPNIPLRSGGPKARIAVIPGDGIGKEVTPVAVQVIKAATAKRNRPLEFVEFDWGADKYLRESISLPEGAVEMLRDEFDAILFGALGDPRVPSNQYAADILLGLRFKLDLYVNARPTELFHDRLTPLRDRTTKDIHLMVFRENTEGIYIGAGGFFKKNTPDEIAIQEDINSRKGVERILRHAFNYARSGGLGSGGSLDPQTRVPHAPVTRVGLGVGSAGASLAQSSEGPANPIPASRRGPALLDPMSATNPDVSAGSPSSAPNSSPSRVVGGMKPLRLCMSDKSNAMTFAGDLWQRVFKSLRAEYPEVESRHLYIDTLAMELVRDPGQFDVIVTNNLFGDIISDLAAQLAGGLGLAPSGNIHPGRTSLFEPVHGSAPNIAGKRIANPFGAVLASSMLLEFLGWQEESVNLKQSVKSALAENVTTPDLGGLKVTLEVADYLASRVLNL
jgi:isocitrate/isopropylmalate dehydrogenase